MRLSHYIGEEAAGRVGDSDCVELSRHTEGQVEIIHLRLAGGQNVRVESSIESSSSPVQAGAPGTDQKG